MENELRIFLPYPPTVNHYWGRNGSRTFIKARGIEFRKNVKKCFEQLSFEKITTSKVTVTIKAYMPDNHKRDIDNLLKATLDAITHTELVWADDNQVDKLSIERVPKKFHKFENGVLEVTISKISQ